MMSAGFDTLEVAKRLKGAGFDDAQAEAITGVLRESREADLSRLATKDDIALVKDDIARVAQKYIDPDRALIVIVGNAGQVREPLGTLGIPLHEIDVEGNAIVA